MNSEPDNENVVATIDYGAAVVSIAMPDTDTIRLPLALFDTKVKVGRDGISVLTMTLRADELHVVQAPPTVVEIVDVPELVDPGESFEAQFRRAAGHTP